MATFSVTQWIPLAGYYGTYYCRPEEVLGVQKIHPDMRSATGYPAGTVAILTVTKNGNAQFIPVAADDWPMVRTVLGLSDQA